VSSSFDKAVEIVLCIAAKAIESSGAIAIAVQTATLSVAETLAELCRSGIAADIKRLKEDGLTRSHAGAEIQSAKAKELLAQAIRTENEAIKAKAESAAIILKAEGDREVARADAIAKLVEAIAKLNALNGSVAVDPGQIDRLLNFRRDDPPSIDAPKE
jgi:hypothetical protein